MRLRPACLLSATALLLCGLSPSLGGEMFSRVVIDPGHGGIDPGSSAFGMVEKELTLDLARRLERILSSHGLKTELTRRTDKYVELGERAERANAKPGTIFVSIHFNAHTDRSISGTETLYWPGSAAAREMASYVQSELGRRLVTRNRGFKPERLKVLEKTKCTAILIECGFISNRWESQRCGAEWFRQIIAEEIAQGILRYRDV
ncbi:N-acetylmuramoyl-L-alanine amidase [Verrucomicrobiales bacterium]|jgi:N-acetylmuramoyl-L-alanine amidase|nr:N-acetylmuramoyl-L-alanine amidase [Verrucomicrobiales bacterium]MDA9921911.1 N-acetylmuramoyl-L-alanine amidase [Verrucomicrobiales bacterium]MDB2496160.1 N-acetylmuramoyl-L-alanine amidase [Verrucomicrobiales bacterium]MDB3940425.1 N-acetylmuramoyl-L-alanine amidase [Verrucomicrobiales bacterium]